MPECRTIFALSSGALPAAVAILRISGPSAKAAVETLCGRCPPPRQAALRTLRDPGSGDVLEAGLVLFFAAPASFTGEDVAELQVTGSRALVARLQSLLADMPDLRAAEPGEFARRALSAGKLDLTQAEGLAALVDAETEAERSQAMMAAGGTIRHSAEGWRDRLNRLRADLEASLDFGDAEEDVARELEQSVQTPVSDLRDDIDLVLSGAAAAQRLSRGFTVAIVGPPNAGKSTLLNALSRSDAAIVSDRAGTTRDVIEVPMDIGGLPVTLVDTAGLRATDDPVEAEGVRRAAARAGGADLVIRLGESGTRFANELPVHAKCDVDEPPDDRLQISARTGEGLEKLLSAIGERLGALAPSPEPTVINERQHQHLAMCRDELHLAHGAGDPILAAEHLRRAADALGRLTGQLETDAMLDAVFSRFCIGK